MKKDNQQQTTVAISVVALELARKERAHRMSQGVRMSLGAIVSEAVVEVLRNAEG